MLQNRQAARRTAGSLIRCWDIMGWIGFSEWDWSKIRHVRPALSGQRVGSVVDSQQVERPVIGSSGVERVQNASEDRVFWLDSGKQGCAGAELEVVGRAEDVASGAVGMEQQGFTTFDQTWPEDRMRQVIGGFIEIFDGVKAGGGAVAEAVNLRKDEPHPVSVLPARPEFLDGGGVGVLLGDEKAIKVHC